MERKNLNILFSAGKVIQRILFKYENTKQHVNYEMRMGQTQEDQVSYAQNRR